MRWLNYQHFFYFWRVASRGSITEAARELRLSQPTISAQLKLFEETLGESLFVREGRNIKLSDAGKIAFRYAEQVFTTGNEFLSVLEGTYDAPAKQLKVGIADVVPKLIAYHILEPAFSNSSAQTVTCYEDKTERLLAELAISEVDLVVCDAPVPPFVKVKAYNHHLGDCGVTFLATIDLAKKYKKNFPQSLATAPLLLPTREAAMRKGLERFFDSKAISPHCVAEFQDSAMMKIVAREGTGVMPIPSLVEAEVRREYHLEKVGQTEEVTLSFYLISIERRIKNPVVKAILERAQKRLFPHS